MRMSIAMAVLLIAAVAQARKPTLNTERAREIATLWQDFSVNDDIVKEDYVGFLQVADLDQDGVEEIVYLNSSYCSGSTADCPNGITVLSKLIPRKTHMMSASADEWEIRARKTGYTPDANEQIPGEVMSLAVAGNRIEVVFVVQKESPICKREPRNADGSQRCPAPGRYTWVYAWKRGNLTRVAQGERYERNPSTANFPEPLMGTWVTAGMACGDPDAADPKHTVRLEWNRMTGKGEQVWPTAVTLLSQTPWAWRVITASAKRPHNEVPAVFLLTETESRLIIAEQSRVRTFDRCR
ncbi:hypothetical protein JH271_20330 [Xanthomonas campestris pv. campestris]|uniref:hypothetical protein n=1 Tax=Xanthomonas campestris TaxID=339 RepID=UPI0023780AB5|nr:hypothetical protein [Xanthomonas campestris]WDK58374.1 hypothetical protein JH301_01075 [Xanthomonas campestris pv. campestris]WDK62724.1 hypothetical protein JH271_20330 [Xanthomonas campestris pv. campestris]WDK66760.1 hypothetical protein JH258_20350 [Xanthomonas campestris pv. campestris]WDK70639.1 hypothetical protein JH284_19525 [Xanthomonas campestris pv. campestris]WDK74831.1 hypothetical protein JH294_20350 [Xanthomonas campestris pv. campestris]